MASEPFFLNGFGAVSPPGREGAFALARGRRGVGGGRPGDPWELILKTAEVRYAFAAGEAVDRRKSRSAVTGAREKAEGLLNIAPILFARELLRLEEGE